MCTTAPVMGPPELSSTTLITASHSLFLLQEDENMTEIAIRNAAKETKVIVDFFVILSERLSKSTQR